jgi:photosystem II stability/assembly factor-like uncharacterized protein
MKASKKYVILAFILIQSLNLINSQNQWVRQSSPTTKWLYRCSFVDTMNGWAAGDSGVIIHTSNGGTNWVLQNSGIYYFIEDVFFLNPRLGWAISNDYFAFGTMILKTTNGGSNWEVTRYPDSTLILTSVHYIDSLNGFLSGFTGTILKTTNAGNNWIKCVIDTNFYKYFPVKKFSFLNLQYGIASGGIMDMAGTIWRTSDYGYNWTLVDTTPEPLNDVSYYSLSLALSTGGDFEFGGSFSRSFSGGAFWTDSTVGIFGAGQSIAIRTLNEIWVPLGFSQLWMYSKDTGKTWESYPAPDTSAIYDAEFVSPSKGWAFGINGCILKYDTTFAIGIKKNQFPVSAELFQNYPNPFNPTTTISYRILRTSKVKITLFDVTGREVKIILNDFKHPGDYRIKVNSEGLSSGVYFYKLETQGFSESKKMVILK